MTEYGAYLANHEAYSPERPILSEAEFTAWCARWDRDYAAAWAQEPPDYATITLLETMLCV